MLTGETHIRCRLAEKRMQVVIRTLRRICFASSSDTSSAPSLHPGPFENLERARNDVDEIGLVFELPPGLNVRSH